MRNEVEGLTDIPWELVHSKIACIHYNAVQADVHKNLSYFPKLVLPCTLSVADLGEGFRGSEPPLSSGNNYADRLE